MNYQQKLELKLEEKKYLEQLLEVTSLLILATPQKPHLLSKKKVLIILKMNTHCHKGPLVRLICRYNTISVQVAFVFLGSCEVGSEVYTEAHRGFKSQTQEPDHVKGYCFLY